MRLDPMVLTGWQLFTGGVALILHDAVLEWRYLAALLAVGGGIALVNSGGRRSMMAK